MPLPGSVITTPAAVSGFVHVASTDNNLYAYSLP
jgi:hypothetical protein